MIANDEKKLLPENSEGSRKNDRSDAAYLHHYLANIFKKKGQLESALSHYRTALYWDPDYAEAHNNLAVLFYQQNKLEQACQHYTQAIHLKPDYLEAHFNLGLTFLAQAKKEAAISQFSRVLMLNSQASYAHRQLALIYWQSNQFEKVAYHYKELLKQRPHSAELLNNLAALALKQNQADKAIDYLQRALTIEPQQKSARSNLAAILLQKNQLKEAIWHYSLYLELEPNDKEALYNRAYGLMLAGQLPKAIKDLEKILALEDTHIDAHGNLAAIHLKQGNKPAALMHYEQILKLKKDHTIATYLTSALTQTDTPSTAPLEYVRNLFDNYALGFDTHLQEVLHYQTPELLRRLVTPHLTSKKYRLLDLGCGTGLSGIPFADLAEALTGIDLSANMIHEARKKACYQTLLVNDILSGLTQLNQDYDLILCVDTLVYFGELDLLFSKVASRLKTDGLFLLSIEPSNKSTPPYHLQTTGRYQHQPDYVIHTAIQNQLRQLDQSRIQGRFQEHKPVTTDLFVFKKN